MQMEESCAWDPDSQRCMTAKEQVLNKMFAEDDAEKSSKV